MTETVFLGVTANVIILVAVVIFGTAVIGLFKFSDTYQRISAVGTAAGLGISLLMISVFLLTPSWANFAKLLIILFLQLATSSIGSMAIARSSYLTGTALKPGYFDHLAEDQSDDESTEEIDEEDDEEHSGPVETANEQPSNDEDFIDPRF